MSAQCNIAYMESLPSHMNPQTLSETVERVPLRNGFGEGLVTAAEADPRIVGLCADLTESTRMDAFQKKFPERFIEIGVAEQNLAGVASGMAALGTIPFISSYAMFSPGRNWEQIRTTICYNNQPVKIVGSHAGISVGPDGGTHQAIEDIALMRVIPRMVVVAPCDVHEAYRATRALALDARPAYLRLTREKTPVMTTPDTPFALGSAYPLWESEKKDVAIIGYGPILHHALRAAHLLAQEGVGVTVLNMHTIKPLDTKAIVSLAQTHGAVVTVEEHQVRGGIGSAVAEVLAQQHPVPMEYVGVHDRFGQSGTPEELMEEYGMGVGHIADAVRRVVQRKR